MLAELETRLPAIRTQASQVQLVYDSGRRKVRVERGVGIPDAGLDWRVSLGRNARARSPMVES